MKPCCAKNAHEALEFHLIRRPQEEARLRLPGDQTIASLTPLELLETYWKSIHTEPKDLDILQTLAPSIIQSVSGGEPQEITNRNRIMSNTLLEILFIFILILINGFFAMSEIALVSARKLRLEQHAEEGDKGVKDRA